MAMTLAERVWRKVDRSGGPDACWPWTGARDVDGYGRHRYGGRAGTDWLAHRLVWWLTFGRIPRALELCHRCDNPPCCNPRHLFLGTHADNMRDARVKGRNGAWSHPERVPRGEAHGCAVLTDAAVIEIRRRSDTGEPRVAVARDFGVSRSMVYRIATRRNWRHLAEVA